MIAKDKPENANKHGNDAYNRRVGIQRATSRLTKEESEQIDELSKGTLANYVNKAGDSRNAQGYNMGKANSFADMKKSINKDVNRMSGISRATKRLAKEDVELSAEELARIEEIAKGL